MDRTGSRHGIAAGSPAVLLIGIHREELAFGERVADGLTEPGLSLLRIPEGISGQRPRQDQLLRVGAQHQALYEQVALRVVGRARLLIDLHCGQDDAGPGADLISPSLHLLGCLEGRLRRIPQQGTGTPPRLVYLQSETDVVGTGNGPAHREGASPGGGSRRMATVESIAARIPSAHTLIPRALWDAPGLTYVGLEVFRPEGDDGAAVDLAHRAIRLVLACLDTGQGCGAGNGRRI